MGDLCLADKAKLLIQVNRPLIKGGHHQPQLLRREGLGGKRKARLHEGGSLPFAAVPGLHPKAKVQAVLLIQRLLLLA